MKIIGLSKHKEKISNIFGQRAYNRNVQICKGGQLKKIHSITFIPTIINHSFSFKEINNRVARVKIDFIVEYKIIYFMESNMYLKAYKGYFVEEMYIDVPQEIAGYDHSNGRLKDFMDFKIYIEEGKGTIDGGNSISMSLFITVDMEVEKVKNIKFICSLETGDENLFSYSEKNGLIQKSFFLSNEVRSIDYSEGCGYMINFNEHWELYKIQEDKLSKLPIAIDENIGEIVKVISGGPKELFIAAKRDDSVTLYRYKDTISTLLSVGISEFIDVFYNFNSKSLIYMESIAGEVRIISRQAEDKEEVLLNLDGTGSNFKVSKNGEMAVFILNEESLVLVNLKEKSNRIINYKHKFNCILQIFFTGDEDILMAKVKSHSTLDIFEIDIVKGRFRNVTNNTHGVFISDVYIGYESNYMYLSDNSGKGFNIYKVNIENLKKDLIVELQAKDIKFLY